MDREDFLRRTEEICEKTDMAGRRWRSVDPWNSSEYGSVDKKTCGMLLLMIPIMLK